MTEHFDPAADSAILDAATAQLMATAHKLTEADVIAPSGLPGWTRGHLLSHLARNADAYRGMLEGARRGELVEAYPNREERDGAIESGSSRELAAQLTDLSESCESFARCVRGTAPDAWSAPIVWPGHDQRQASALIDGRIREVAIHHVDLDFGYTAADWPVPLAARILESVAVRFDALQMPPSKLAAVDSNVSHTFGDGSGPVLQGPSYALAWWLLGRHDGAGLNSSSGQLPVPPAWV